MKVLLNRFPIRRLNEAEASPLGLEVRLDPPPGLEEVYPLRHRVAHTAGGVVYPGRTGLLSWTPPEELRLEGEVLLKGRAFRYTLLPKGRLSAWPEEREALEGLARRLLEKTLPLAFKGYLVRRRQVLGRAAREETFWRFRKGAQLDLLLNKEGWLVLKVELIHAFEAKEDLEAWHEAGLPLPRWVRNRYESRGKWRFQRLGEEDPQEVLLDGGLSLLEYHRKKGRLGEGDPPGRVVWLEDPKRPGRAIPHLARLLEPVITLDLIDEVPEARIGPKERLLDARKVAARLAPHLGLKEPPRPLALRAHPLPPPSLEAHRRIGKPADILRTGALEAGALGVGLLRLDGGQGWPAEVRRALEEVGQKSGVSFRFLEAPPLNPGEELEFQSGLRRLKAQGAEALLVLTPHLPEARRNRLKTLALQEGLPTQLLNPPYEEGHRLSNALLGLLGKLGWKLFRLAGEYPAELALGFDAGGMRSLRFGGGACAVTADGGLLFWSLPEAQVGERLAQEVVWDLVKEALQTYQEGFGTLPRRILLLRDGFVQREEFNLSLQELERQGIAFDLLSVRKGSGDRVFAENGGPPKEGLYVPLDEGAFLLTTAIHPGGKGTPRPLKVEREVGDTPILDLARQLYHLSRLYPGSGYRFPRLPAPLHLADRLVWEVGQLGGVRALAQLNRRRLFFL